MPKKRAEQPLLELNDIVNNIFEGDCLQIMKMFPDRCIDMVLCDLPYGTTQNKWDSVIPLDELFSIEEELQDKDWVSFNHTILNAYGTDVHYESICNSLKSMRKARRAAKEKYEIKVNHEVKTADYVQLQDNYSIAAEPNNH